MSAANVIFILALSASAARAASPILFEATVSPIRGSATLGQWGLALVETEPDHVLAMWEAGDSERDVNAVWSARSSDGGRSWHGHAPLHAPPGVSSSPAGFFRHGHELHAILNESSSASSTPLAVVERVSLDAGRTWARSSLWWRQAGGAAMQPVVLRDGEIAVPIYTSMARGSRLTAGATVVLPLSDDLDFSGRAIERPCYGAVDWMTSATPRGALEPALVECASGTWLSILRTEGTGRLYASYSQDFGKTWGEAAPLPLASPAAIARALTLASGAIIVVWNDIDSTLTGPRNRLSVARSFDCGATWSKPTPLRWALWGVFSNHGIVERHDGVVLVAYQDLHRGDRANLPRGADSVELVAFDPRRLP